nr:copia protein [Tanacetum cinerariifolium]
MALKDFKKFFKRRGKFVRQPHDDKKNFRKIKEDKKEKEDRSEDDSKKEEICFMAIDNNEVRLKVKLEPDEWIKDSGCLRHVTGNKHLFSSYKAIDGGNVVFGSNTKSKIVRIGYNQEEGIDFDETYAPVARLESIRILLAYACAHDFKLFQMDVKNAFLNGFINEEVHVAQPPGFVDFEKPNHVFKLNKALYGLKQAPKAWYDRLKVQIKQLDDGIFFNQSKYTKEMLKKFSLEDSKPIKTHMSSETKFTRDEDGESVDDTKYHGMIDNDIYSTVDACPNACKMWKAIERLKQGESINVQDL